MENSVFIDGRLYTFERYESETNPEFAERLSFMLFFRHDISRFERPKYLSLYHANMMFKGVIYSKDIEREVK